MITPFTNFAVAAHLLFQLEIMHGVLNDVNLCKDRSFFYLRDKADMLNLAEEQLKVPTDYTRSEL